MSNPTTLKKGPGPGRPKGSQNVVTRDYKEAIQLAFEKLGAVDYLVRVGKEDPKTFCSLLRKIMPPETKADNGEWDLKWHLAENLGAALEKFNATLGKFLQLSMNEGMEQVALGATAFLDAMSRIAIARLLLEAALIAEEGLAKAEADSQDAQFYQGKIASARYYARHLLPVATTELETILTDDSSPLDIPDGGFSLAF